MRHPDWLQPDFGPGLSGVAGVMTTRAGGRSSGAYASLNLKTGIGDDDDTVGHNQALVAEASGAGLVWLKQVHGTRVVRLTSADLGRDAGADAFEADAAVTTEPGIACAVQVADCLPVLFAAPGGVAAAHAGWRGLAAGVLEATLASLCDAAGCSPSQVAAWLGPSIGPDRFEVGDDVRQAFAGAAPERFRALRPGKWLADLPNLARDRLTAAGLHAVRGGTWCTVQDPSRFFSYRRDGVTGRMAGLVWRR